MELKFYAKLKIHKRNAYELSLLIGIAGFILAIIIGVLLKIYYYLYLLVPMFYLILLLNKIRKRNNSLVDGIIYLKFEKEFFNISEMYLDGKPFRSEKTTYKCLEDFNIYKNGNVMIKTSVNSYNFFLKNDDLEQLSRVMYTLLKNIRK